MKTLVKGTKYDVATLVFVNWASENGNVGDTTGYDVWAYFGPDGMYLGPDADGIYPEFMAD